MTRDDELALIAEVGRGLVRLGLNKHVELCRAFYRDFRRGVSEEEFARRAFNGEGWEYSMIVEWARILKLPPHEKAYPVRPRREDCTCDRPRGITRVNFPGGYVVRCASCGATWMCRAP